MKKILLRSLFIIPIIAYADNWTPPITHKLTIISENEIGAPKELKEETLQKRTAIKTKGFNEKENPYARFLLNLKMNAVSEIRAFRGTTDPSDTHLKENPKAIPLAFTFKKLPIDNSAIIGYAPIGTYVTTPHEGWNGIKVFFEDKALGTCAYEYTNLKLSNGGVLMTKEGLQYSVNNKPTIISAEGNNESGYTYSVTWYNDIEVSRLDCATMLFQKGLTDNLMELSKKIDSKMF